MVMDVKSAFRFGDCRRRIYVELPHKDLKHGHVDFVGRLQKAMYGTRVAPQIWATDVQKVMDGLGFVISIFQPSVYYHPSTGRLVVVHVDDFLCSGEDREEEVKYLGLTIRVDI